MDHLSAPFTPNLYIPGAAERETALSPRNNLISIKQLSVLSICFLPDHLYQTTAKCSLNHRHHRVQYIITKKRKKINKREKEKTSSSTTSLASSCPHCSSVGRTLSPATPKAGPCLQSPPGAPSPSPRPRGGSRGQPQGPGTARARSRRSSGPAGPEPPARPSGRTQHRRDPSARPGPGRFSFHVPQARPGPAPLGRRRTL